MDGVFVFNHRAPFSLPVNAATFSDRKLGSGALRFVLRVPAIALKNERAWLRAVSDVDLGLHLRALEHNVVVSNLNLSARNETRLPSFLQNPENPTGGEADRVVGKLGAIDPHKSSSA